MANVAPVGGFKKRRLANTCDSVKMPGNVCLNCRAFESECTYSLSTVKKKGGTEVFVLELFPLSLPNEITVRQIAKILALKPHLFVDSDTKDQYEFAKAQISDILSPLAAYELPDDSGNILKILTEIASYARSLEIKLEKQSNSSVYPLHSVPSTHVEQDYPARGDGGLGHDYTSRTSWGAR
ncbi:hypothetical protein C8R41DRAFT_915914 [Lentinula lateritia]|uniref:Uncharacterized protein n=1 Tax=Lentinula lateritia TaxID=40482 RepID=A0ABQ8VR17_9AGAR|nr:hypothetical protein C8R41DRAFT_915914 [Lentinula lateritia]